MTHATVFADLAAELPVPDDGTLSRTLYQDEDLRLVGFAFAAGEELSSHASALSVAIQVLQGRLQLTLGEEPAELVAGGWVHMPPHLPHAVTALEPTVMLLTMVKPHS
ncbi:MAG: cupin domain-containing protein [Actinomycetota bacterium]|nr:cupin domain-containing protein [Actinomycetota bacterium]MDH4353081.1 cupin domain-containing protein [Actinomycetota bacterium]MDH5278671.1 cupin domain-containing protein [Actinomycetota bacterium]